VTLDEFVAKFERASRAGSGFKLRCPAHEDRQASLKADVGRDGRILLRCFAGCTTDAICAALGLSARDLFATSSARPRPPRSAAREVCRYAYRDIAGQVLYSKVRLVEPKDFYLEAADGRRTLDGLPRVIYRLDELLEARTVLVAEGEKDVDLLWGWGLVATCNDSGASENGKAPKWTADHTRQLHEAGAERVVILPDEDAAGLAHAEAVARSCTAAGLAVAVIRLPGLVVNSKADVSDWAAAGHTVEELRTLIAAAPAWSPSCPTPPPRTLQALDDGRYVFAVPEFGATFDLDRLRRERHQLIGELSVRCTLPGARTYAGVLSTADFNLSSAQTRQRHGALLGERAQTGQDLDWAGVLEEFCQRVLATDRAGRPAVLLRDVPRPQDDEDYEVEGLRLLARHPVVGFGDGGAAKSLTGLYFAGRLTLRGVPVLFADWELAAEDHRDRLERLFGADMPAVRYVRCERPLVHEIDRLRRIVRDDGLGYCVLDSVAFACDGPPEAAEVASAYFRATRQLGVGSLHIAHISKAEGGDQKPFGSAFWHNGARATWFFKAASVTPDGLTIGCFNRKANTGPLRPAVGFEITFAEGRVTFRRADVADVEELAAALPLWQRMRQLLGEAREPLTAATIAEQLGAPVKTVEKVVIRSKGRMFARLDGADGVSRIRLVPREEVA
jgi:hypothetical protein